MSLSFITCLSIVEDQETGDVALNKDRLDHIFNEYHELYDQSDNELTETQRKEETLRKLASKLDLGNTRTNMDYLSICISEKTPADAELEIINKFLGPVEYMVLTSIAIDAQDPTTLNIVASVPVEKSQSNQADNRQTNKTASKFKKSAEQQEDVVQDVLELTCIIYKNLERSEIDEFMEKFLFQKVQDENGQALNSEQTKTTRNIKPQANNAVHPLLKGTILDLFIRKQLTERDTITFKRTRTKFRLVEPVSLTDEFDSWSFDNFQQIFDFWLTIDPHDNQQKPFPTRWKIHPNAVINYIVGGVSDQTGARIQRPTTKSLENFIRDICTIEDNGMADDWYEALTEHEDILTYAHLSNLTMPEWEKVRKLPMNALKTIKFYVDQEKNLVAAQKASTTNDPNKEKKKGKNFIKY